MPRLIDGDNVLGTWPGRARTENEKRALIVEIRALARRGGGGMVVVFDGPPPDALAEAPDVVFSGPGRRADDVILARLRSEPDVKGWTVVTHDRSLADRCRWLGARIERPEMLRRRIESSTAAEKPEGPVDVEFWKDYFDT